MPRLTHHAAISLEPTVLVGWMTWRAPMMQIHLNGIKWLRSSPCESNEDQAVELGPKLYRLYHFIKTDTSGLFHCGPSIDHLLTNLKVIEYPLCSHSFTNH